MTTRLPTLGIDLASFLSVTLIQAHAQEKVARGRMIPQASAQPEEKPAGDH